MAGEIKERLPVVQRGLQQHFPMDGTARGTNRAPILDYSTWQNGQAGSVTGFSQNGASTENFRITGEDPWGRQAVLWEARPVVNNGSDGGWNTTSFPIDNTKTYRFSTWVRRSVIGTGSCYLGLYGYGTVNGVKPVASETISTNAYFWSGGIATEEWILLVGHVHPATYTGGIHPDSGRYTLTTRIGSITNDYRWLPESTTASHRSYLYYSTDAATRQLWCYPRVDIIDGTEPTLQELLQGEGNIIKPTVNSNTVLFPEGIVIEEGTTNILPTIIAMGEQVLPSNNGAFTTNTQSTERAYIGTYSMKGTQIAAGGQRGFYTTWYAATPSLPYSGSFYVYTEEEITYTATIAFNTPAGSVSIGTGTVKSIPRTWTRVTVNNAIAPSDATQVRLITSGSTVQAGVVVYLDALQLEQKSYSTSFVAGTRTGDGALEIATKMGTSDFTVTGEFVPHANSDALPNGSYFLTLGSGFILKTYNGRPYIEGNTITGVASSNVHQYFYTSPGVRVQYCVKRSGSTLTWQMKSDDGQNQFWTITDPTVAAKLVSKLSFAHSWGGLHRNVSVYNRALSDIETTKLFKGSFSISKDGSLVSSVKEYDSILIVDDHTVNISDQTYTALGLWPVAEPDLSRFVEANSELGPVYFTGEVYISDATYYPRSFEFTKENNTKGISQPVVVPNGGWKVGWNTIFFKADAYFDALNTPWNSMTRLEVYRSGPATGTDAAQYIRMKNIRLVKADAYGKWMKSKKGTLHTIQVKEGKVL